MIRMLSGILAVATAASGLATELPRIFVTSVTGTGDLSSWPDAHGRTGLQAADEICRSRAAATSIANSDQYIALISDSQDDAYCRWHGESGKINTQCNAGALPVGAGPWYRMDDQAAMDIAENAVGSYPVGGYVPRPIEFDEFGHALPDVPADGSLAYTATWQSGVLDSPASSTCGDWTSTQGEVTLGSAFRGYGGVSGHGWTCDKSLHLICLEKGRHGPALPRKKPSTARQIFVTSSSGTGNLSTWNDADGAASIAAADNICRAHATRAALPLAGTYKAWLSTSLEDAIDRFDFEGALFRADGVRVTASLSQLGNGTIEAPIQFDESGREDWWFYDVWTGTQPDGRTNGATCGDWTSTNAPLGGVFGQSWASDGYWTSFLIDPAAGCSNAGIHLYCLGDNDSLFMDGVD